MDREEKQKRADEIYCEPFLKEIITEDYSKENWEKWNEKFMSGKCSFEQWEKYGEEKVTEEKPIERPQILKDTQGRSASNLCEDVAELLKGKNVLFFRPNSRKIVEVGNVKIQSTDENLFTGFSEMSDKRFVTIIEKYCDIGYWHKTRFGETFEVDSLSPAKTSIILNSYILEDSLPQIQRIFNCPLPIIYKNKLTFPKKGYDKRFDSWRNESSIKISNEEMPLKKAKEIIDKIYCEFCFGSEQDRVNAISSLLTPFVRGLFNKFNTITPAFFYLGNREGVGKDYCASIPGLVIDGFAQEDTPICDNGKPNDEELRKKITTAIRYGRKRMHFANNKGYLNSSILEKLITDPMWIDRILGKTEEISYPNELDISLSGNIPIRYSDDLERRTIFINLFYSKENINERKFQKEDLHLWILENRDLILSALFALVKNWIDNGKPNGSQPFASFAEWANICGGIMENAGYGTPCIKDISNKILTGDSDSDEITELYNLCYEKYPNKPIKKDNIIFIIKQQNELFSYFDFDKRSDQTRFSIKLRKYIDREFSNIVMNIVNPKERTARQEFIFREVGKVGNVGNTSLSPVCEENIYIQQVKVLPKVTQVTKTEVKQ